MPATLPKIRPVSSIIVASKTTALPIVAVVEQFREAVRMSEGEVIHRWSVAAAMIEFSQIHPDIILVAFDDFQQSCDFCHMIREREGLRHTALIIAVGSMDQIEERTQQALAKGADDIWWHGLLLSSMRARLMSLLHLKAKTDQLRSANHRLELATLELKTANEKLQQITVTDDLTTLANMRGFSHRFRADMKSCVEGHCGLSILMLDVDYFKKVNDTFNHLVGSHVLSSMGLLIRGDSLLPPAAFPARYGGDEFIILLPAPSIREALDYGENLRQRIANHTFTYGEDKIKITASIGIAWVPPQFSGPAEDVIKAADVMLYRSKEDGRNRCSAMVLKYPIRFDKIGRHHLYEDDEEGPPTYGKVG